MNHSKKFSILPLNPGKSRSFDALVVIFSAILAVIITILILKDAILGDNQIHGTNAKVIGIVEVSVEKVMFRPSADPVWSPASRKQALRPRDLVFTDVKSSAKIILESHSEIELGEKTLLSLDFEDDKPLIKLMSGDIRIRNTSGSKIQIKLGKMGPFTIDDSSVVSLQKYVGKNANIKVLKGKIFKDDAMIIEGQKAGFDQEGALTDVQVISLELEKPLNGSEIFLTSAKKVTVDFVWLAKTSQNFTLEIAKDLKFENLVLSRNLTAQNCAIDLPIGTYFWRVQSHETDGRHTSDVRSLIVQKQKDQGGSLNKSNDKILRPPDVPRELRLEKNQENKSGFFRPDRRNILALLFYVFFYENRSFAAPQNSSDIDVNSKGSIKMNEKDTDQGGIESDLSKQKSGSLLTWESVEGASGYHVEIAEDFSFQKVIRKYFVKSSTLELGGLGVGRYYLRIATVNRSGARGDFSAASILNLVNPIISKTSQKAKFSAVTSRSTPNPKQGETNAVVQLQFPLDDFRVEMTGHSEFVSLMWVEAANERCRRYIIEVKPLESSVQQRLQYLKANFHSWKVVLSAGIYRWRVRSDPDIRAPECPGWSSTRLFSLRRKQRSESAVLPGSVGLPSQIPIVRRTPSSVITGFFAPGTYLYQSQLMDPEVKVEARFLNHLGIEMFIPPAESNDQEIGYGGIVKLRRLSAALFNQESKGKVENQDVISFQLYEYELGLRLERVFSDKDSHGFLMLLDASVLAKEQGIFNWNEVNTLSLVKKTSYYPKVHGEFHIGIGKTSRFFAASFYGLSREGAGNQGFSRTHGIGLGLELDSGQESLITQIRFGLNWESSQGSIQVTQKENTEGAFMGFKTTRNMCVLALSTGI